jgi:hypothetical protein
MGGEETGDNVLITALYLAFMSRKKSLRYWFDVWQIKVSLSRQMPTFVRYAAMSPGGSAVAAGSRLGSVPSGHNQ